MKKTPKLNLKKLEPHPLGEMFPPMGDDEYASLKGGMKLNGYDERHPIILFEGKILEGNNRYTAAKDTKTEPKFRNFEDLKFPGSAIDYVIQENLSRRNLTPSQLSTLGAELVEKMEAEEKAQEEAAKAANSQPNPKSKRKKGDKVAKAAKMVGVSPRSVATARKVKKADPAAAKEVKKGGKSLNAAATEADKKKSAEEAKSEEFKKAKDRIDGILGEGFSLIAAKKLQSKHILQLSGLDADEMKRTKPFIEAGWSLKAALGYKSVNLSYAHNIRQLTERALAQGGKFTLIIDDWTINVEKKTEPVA